MAQADSCVRGDDFLDLSDIHWVYVCVCGGGCVHVCVCTCVCIHACGGVHACVRTGPCVHAARWPVQMSVFCVVCIFPPQLTKNVYWDCT